MTKVQELRERIERGTYEVNVDAIAEAIVKRLLAEAERGRLA